ncbi:hypothetical protein AB6A40_001808 [Gnathostoma spinigerum]|uniref:VWFA domain-containing protein n=1 Tax=Gnathostoma spinigerum TaxID=75299 RepID=A0ABD6EAD9_9BILA
MLLYYRYLYLCLTIGIGCVSVAKCCADFVFIIDGSSSVGSYFENMVGVVKKLVLDFDFDAGHRVGILEYGSSFRKEKWPRLYLNETQTKGTVLERIAQLHLVSGLTDTGQALEFVKEKFIPQRRNNVPLVIILLTDGFFRDIKHVVTISSKLAAVHNVHLYSLATSRPFSVRGLLAVTNGDSNRIFYQNNATKPLIERLRESLGNFIACGVYRRTSNDIRRAPQRAPADPLVALSTRRVVKRLTTTTKAITSKRLVKTPRTTTVKPFTGKPGCLVDIVFLMDFSTGVLDKREKYIDMATSLISSLKIGRFNTQVAMMRYSGPGRTETIYHLNKHENAQAAVDEMKKSGPLGGTTRTGEAINSALDEFSEKNGGREKAKKILILFTDGYSQDDPTEAAQKVYKNSIELDVVAIDDVDVPPNREELKAIVGNRSPIYTEETFGKLRSRIVDALQRCE